MAAIEERVDVAYRLKYSYSYLLLHEDAEKTWVQEFWTCKSETLYSLEKTMKRKNI